ncbi:DNA-binding GntR family transcriptional regulator [Paraburkholderia sp. GAS448]|jgi:DNA-binding GntR family transcriptional regulator
MSTTDDNIADVAVRNGPRGGRGSLRPLTMPEQIAESITDAVLRGDYQPGDRVREQELASQFQVSRGPIREALRILEKSGVVRILPQRGAHITQLSAKEVNDLFEVRRSLIGLLARKICPAPPALIKAVDQQVRTLEALGGQESATEEHAKISMLLSRLLLAACDNHRLVEMLESLVNQTARYTRLGLREPQRRTQSAASWRSFVIALEAGNADLAAAALEGLVEASRVAAVKHLQQG